MVKIITQEFGVPKVSQPLAELLNYTKAKHKTFRYWIHYVCVKEGLLTVTDGRKLLEITLSGVEIKNGLYHLTGEGFLLKIDDAEPENYPNYSELFTQTEQIGQNHYFVSAGDETQMGKALIIEAICGAGCLLNFSMLYSTLNRMARCDCSSIEIFKQPSNNSSVILITSELHGLKFRYLQMPLTQ